MFSCSCLEVEEVVEDTLEELAHEGIRVAMTEDIITRIVCNGALRGVYIDPCPVGYGFIHLQSCTLH